MPDKKDENVTIEVAGNPPSASPSPASDATIISDHETAPTTAEAEAAEKAAAEAADPKAKDKPEMRAAKRGHKFVTYQGHATSMSYEDPETGEKFKFEPGVPVEMPKAAAEALLTHPFEEIVAEDEIPVAQEGEE